MVIKSAHLILFAAAAAAAPEAALAQSHPSEVARDDRYGPWVASQVAPGVHVLAAASDYFGPAIGNVTLIEQSDGFVVIDSGLTVTNGRDVVRYAARLSPKPIKAVAITHWHNDHPQGVSAIRDAFPKVRIISTVATEAGMLGPEAYEIDYKPSAAADEAIKGQVKGAIDQLSKLRDDPATAPDRRERVTKALAQFQRFPDEFRGTYIVPPTETFTTFLKIDDPLRPVELRHLGRANTDGDLIAWLPKERIVASGDIVVGPTPFGFGSFPKDWIDTLGKLKALNFATLIPGHGDPQADTAYLDKLIASIEDIRAKVAPLAKAGVPVGEIKAKIDWTDTLARFSDTPRNKANFEGQFLDPMIPSAYKEALGQPIIQGEGFPAASFKPVPPKPSSKRHSS